jgi:hypothetical protein
MTVQDVAMRTEPLRTLGLKWAWGTPRTARDGLSNMARPLLLVSLCTDDQKRVGQAKGS